MFPGKTTLLMAGLRVSKELRIRSLKGEYSVEFKDGAFKDIEAYVPENSYFIIDKKVRRLYAPVLDRIASKYPSIEIEASEYQKSLEKFPLYVEKLVSDGVRRGFALIAIGGGIIEDITCFLASVLFRGLEWRFFPTTLLAQADSCIGSKSSINCGSIKNVIGTFCPPSKIVVDTEVLGTLEDNEMSSGIGEMLKVHIMNGQTSFAKIADAFDELRSDRGVLTRFICESLAIKKKYIEEDEFDVGYRNLLNYGHTFGHAIESATSFQVPHGIAVTLGIDLANYYAAETGLISVGLFEIMHVVLKKNYNNFCTISVPFDAFIQSILRDKKNTNSELGLILPTGAEAEVKKIFRAPDERFQNICRTFFETVRG